MLRPSGQNTVCYDQVYDLLLNAIRIVTYKLTAVFILTKFMICYWSERCMLRLSLRFVAGQNTVSDKVYDLLLVKTLKALWFVTGQNTVCYDQVYDLLLVRTLYGTTKFMICYWSERCMLRPSLWFVTGQNTVCYDQVYDLLLVRTLYVKTKFMICYWSEHCMLRPSLWFVTGQNTVWQTMTKFMICYWSEHCMLRPSLWFVTFQNAICYDK